MRPGEGGETCQLGLDIPMKWKGWTCGKDFTLIIAEEGEGGAAYCCDGPGEGLAAERHCRLKLEL